MTTGGTPGTSGVGTGVGGSLGVGSGVGTTGPSGTVTPQTTGAPVLPLRRWAVTSISHRPGEIGMDVM